MPVLFDTFSLGSVTLRNRMVMSPMTRNRAIGNVPNDLTAEASS
jgi:N-ethylmaleimide reductase